MFVFSPVLRCKSITQLSTPAAVDDTAHTESILCVPFLHVPIRVLDQVLSGTCSLLISISRAVFRCQPSAGGCRRFHELFTDKRAAGHREIDSINSDRRQNRLGAGVLLH